MADRAISELTAVTGVNAEDSFVLQQNNRAMRLTGQILLNWLAEALDGHGGINNIEKTSTSGLVDTYTITFADETEATFTVTNGKAIVSIAKTSTSGLVDTYTITYNSGNPSTFAVTNGNGISQIVKTGTVDLVDTYTITMQNGTQYTFTVTNGEKGDKGDNTYTHIRYSTDSPTQDSDIHSTPDNWMGIYCGSSSTAPTSYQAYDWFEIKGEKGETGDSVTIVSTAVNYAVGDDGTTVPQNWQSTMPTVPQGKYLWTRTVVTYTDGTTQTPTTTYSSCRNGVDGSGSVNSVNNISPDANHNVTLPMDNVPTTNSGNFVKSGGVALINSRHENSMAYPYDPESTYAVGKFCIHDNQIMRCIVPIEMGEAWDATHWTNVVICEELTTVEESIDDVQAGLAIIVDGDSCEQAVPVNGYAYIKNNTHGLSDGLYKNTSNAAFPVSGGTASGTVFTLVSNGIGNVVKSLSDTKLTGQMSGIMGSGFKLLTTAKTLEPGVYLYRITTGADTSELPSATNIDYGYALILVRSKNDMVTVIYSLGLNEGSNALWFNESNGGNFNGWKRIGEYDGIRGTGTRNTTNTTGGNVYYRKTGSVVILGGWVTLSNSYDSAQSNIIVSGLPKASEPATIPIFDQTGKTMGALYIESGSTNITVSQYGNSAHRGHVVNFCGSYCSNS